MTLGRCWGFTLSTCTSITTAWSDFQYGIRAWFSCFKTQTEQIRTLYRNIVIQESVVKKLRINDSKSPRMMRMDRSIWDYHDFPVDLFSRFWGIPPFSDTTIQYQPCFFSPLTTFKTIKTAMVDGGSHLTQYVLLYHHHLEIQFYLLTVYHDEKNWYHGNIAM